MAVWTCTVFLFIRMKNTIHVCLLIYYYYYYYYYYLIAHLSNSVMMGLDVGFVLKNYTWVSLSN